MKLVWTILILCVSMLIFSYVKKTCNDIDNENDNDLDKYDKFIKEMNNDMVKYNFKYDDRVLLLKTVSKILEEKKKKKNVKDMVETFESGMVRGSMIGVVLNGSDLIGSLVTGASLGAVNTFLYYFGY